VCNSQGYLIAIIITPTLKMAILTRLTSRVWNLVCITILSVFFAFPLALLACLATGLAILFTWVLAYRMLAAAVSKRIDFWRSVDHEPGVREAQIQEAVHHFATGPSLVQTSGPRSGRAMSGGSRVQSTHDRGFDSNYDYDYGYGISNDNDIDNDDDDGSEGLYLGGWRRRNSRTSPTSSRPTTPGTAAYHYRPRSSFGEGSNGRAIPNFSAPYAVMPAAALSVAEAAPPPAANVATRRSTTSGGSRRSSRVLSAENFARREMGDQA